LKGKVFSQVRVFQIGGSTFVVLVFEDKTTFQIALEPQPLVRLSLYSADRRLTSLLRVIHDSPDSVIDQREVCGVT
jgi:hypothetical protein